MGFRVYVLDFGIYVVSVPEGFDSILVLEFWYRRFRVYLGFKGSGLWVQGFELRV